MAYENKAGVFVVRYDSPDALSPERQQDLVAALRTASRVQPLGIVFVVDPKVQMVDHTIPDYWMTVTGDKAIRIAAIAVVTPNPAVSVATRGFSTANILKDTSVAVKPFDKEGPAIEWVVGAVKSAAKQ